MRIALLSFEYPPETGFGGIGTYTWHHARALRDLGHEVHVLAGALEPTRDLVHRDDDGVAVWRYRSDGRRMRMVNHLGRFKLWWTRNRLETAMSMHEALTRLRKRHPLDLIEVPECGAEGLLVSRLHDLPVVMKFHSPSQLIMGSYDVPQADRIFCPFIEKLAIRKVPSYTSASAYLAGEVRAKLGVKRPIAVVPNGVDLSWFDHTPNTHVRERFGIPIDRPMIFFSGRLERRKGIHLCADIASAVLERHDVSFVFAGQDLFEYMAKTMLPALESKGHGKSIYYLGKLGLDDVRSCLKESDIYFIPSLWENCPYSCLEAMAAGRAIVSSDAGGLPELIRHRETGLVARSEEPASFAACIGELLENRELGARLGRAARASVEKSFNHMEIGRRTVAAYESALNGGRR